MNTTSSLKTRLRRTILTPRKIDYLFNHILDGFKSSSEGLQFLKRDGYVSDKEYTDLLEKNADRLISRIHEFKVEHKLLSLFFVFLFTWLQISGEDLDMRRARRVRGGRRKGEVELRDSNPTSI